MEGFAQFAKSLLMQWLSVFLTMFFVVLFTAQARDSKLDALMAELECSRTNSCEVLVHSLERDSMRGCMPTLQEINEIPRYLSGTKKVIFGKFSYAGTVRGPYGYNVWVSGNTVHVQSIIHFGSGKLSKNMTTWFPNGLSSSQKKMTLLDWYNQSFRYAETEWSKYNPFAFKLKVHFDISEEASYAHVRDVGIKNNTRGPYFKRWSPKWAGAMVSHEAGHLLGLDDEYSYVGSVFGSSNCRSGSIMCARNGVSERIDPIHYYLFLRRILCSN